MGPPRRPTAKRKSHNPLKNVSYYHKQRTERGLGRAVWKIGTDIVKHHAKKQPQSIFANALGFYKHVKKELNPKRAVENQKPDAPMSMKA